MANKNRLLAKAQNISSLIMLTTMLGVTGCAGHHASDPTRQYLDSSTGITLTGLQEPIIFQHADPRLAVNVRDYLYAGPVEMNRAGQRSYYLWLGEWSSIDRLPRAGNAEDMARRPEHVVIMLDGLPMELHDSLAPGDISRIIQHPYSVPVESLGVVYMRVSRDQLNKIAAASNVNIRVGDVNQVRTYTLWSGTIRSFGAITKSPAAVNDQRLAEMSDR